MNKNIITLLLVVCIGLLSPTLVYAQNRIELRDLEGEEISDPLTDEEQERLETENRPADISDNANIRAQFIENTQRPSDKVVRYELVLTTNVTSDRVKVTWETLGAVQAIDENQLETTITVNEGNTYRFPLDVLPTGEGVSEIRGKAELFEADGRSLAFVRKNFASNSAGEILPISEEYSGAKLRYQAFIITRNLSLLILVVGGGYWAAKRFLEWYKSDNA